MPFSIELDRTNKTYQPGEKITCKVEITFETPVKVRCIAVRFHGFAATEWSKVKSGRGKKRIKTYAAFEEYFRTYNDLTGERGGKWAAIIIVLFYFLNCLQFVCVSAEKKGNIF